MSYFDFMMRNTHKLAQLAFAILTVGALLVCLLLFSANIWLGNLNQDEGWYLYAAKSVSEGQLPYRDFTYTQGPVLPLFYALFYPIIRQYGVLGGRILTASIGFMTCLFSGWLAFRLLAENKWRFAGGVATFMLIGLNVYQSYFTSIVKTYSLCSLLLVGGFLALSYANRKMGRIIGFSALSGLLMSAAAGTRFSAGAAMAVTGFYLLFRCRLKGWKHWVAYGAGGLVGLLALYAPYIMNALDGVKFGLLEYHTLRSPGSLMESLVFKAGFVSRFVQGYYLIVLLVLLYIILRLFRKPSKKSCNSVLNTGALWGAAVLLTLVHLAAPFPYDDYQVVVAPLIAIVVVVALIRWLSDQVDYTSARGLALITVLFLATTASAFSSPINQEWMVLRRDRIWWKMKNKSDLQKLRDVGRTLNQLAEPGDHLLTQDAYLAVEANMDVPDGLEMGPFSYYPDFDDERIKKVGGVVNKRALLKLLDQAEAPWAAISGYGLTIRSPEVTELTDLEQLELQNALHNRYELLTTVQNFGQGHTPLRIYRRK